MLGVTGLIDRPAVHVHVPLPKGHIQERLKETMKANLNFFRGGRGFKQTWTFCEIREQRKSCPIAHGARFYPSFAIVRPNESDMPPKHSKNSTYTLSSVLVHSIIVYFLQVVPYLDEPVG